jgi:protein Tob/BTG
VTSDCGSVTTASTPSSSPNSKNELSQYNKRSRRERARQARIFVDSSKNQVTPYEGGKTTVLTGGVMLGAPAPKVPARPVQVPVAYRVVRV